MVSQGISRGPSQTLDGLLLGLCLWISDLLCRRGLAGLVLGGLPAFSRSSWILAVIVPVTPLLLDRQRFYEHPLSQRLESLVKKIARAELWMIPLIGLAATVARLEVPSRPVLILFMVLAPLVLILRVVLTRKILVYNYEKGRLAERTVIVGSAADADSFLKGLSPCERLELQVSECFDIDRVDPSEIRKGIRQHAAGRVIFVSPDSPRNENLPFSCEEEGIDVWIVSRNINGIMGVPSLEAVGSNQVFAFCASPAHFWYRFAKRFLDIVGASMGLLLLLPACLVIAVTLKLTSPGPVIFKQVRSGKRGREFTILKFRSMVANAPELHAELAHRNEMQGPIFKIRSDPRITPFGAFLRRTSLDEIPQLVNVLRGEMSLVGPRPLANYETELIENGTHRRRLSVKPGLTCLWQIRGRNSIRNFEDWVRLDIEYIDNASLLLDLSILLRTIPAVLFTRGAY